MPRADRLLFVALPERVVVALQVRLTGFPPVIGAGAGQVNLIAILHPEPPGALHAKTERVGAWQVGVVMQDDAFAPRGPYHRRDLIAQRKPDRRIGVIRSALRVPHNVVVQTPRLAGRTGQRNHPVAASQLSELRHRPDAVGRIQIAVAVHTVLRAPARFVKGFGPKLDPTAVGLFSVVEFDRPQVVLIAAFQMDQFAKKPLAHHAQDRHHIAAVADIFQEKQVTPRAFAGVDELPAFVQTEGPAHLRAGEQSAFHRRHAHFSMPLPGCSDEHRIEFFFLQKISVIVGSVGVVSGLGSLLFLKQRTGPFDHLRVDVRYGSDHAILAVEQQVDVTLSPKSTAEYCDPKEIVRGAGAGC